MTTDIMTLKTHLLEHVGEMIQNSTEHYGQLTIEVAPAHLRTLCLKLRDEEVFQFEQLIDVCGVDYLEYGYSEWVTEKATESGFERAVFRQKKINILDRHGPRFAVIYHLLSVSKNARLRIKVFAQEPDIIVPSLIDVWPSANWFERETFDLYGILFDKHPDLRRILTDYGFIGYPFRKDFPISGYVQMRYDATEERVIYEPVDIPPRVLTPKIIRDDNRYLVQDREKGMA